MLPDDTITVQLWRAFHLGVRATLVANEMGLSNRLMKNALDKLEAVACGDETLYDPSADAGFFGAQDEDFTRRMHIAFRSDRDGGGIFLMGATGESVRRLTDFGFRPAWSPDGSQIAFIRTTANSVDLYVIEATPRPGYQPRSRTAKALMHLHGRLWVDKQDYHLARAEVEVVDTISVGLFLVRLAEGSRATYEQTRVNDEVWLPRNVRAFISVRLGLVKVLHIEQEYSYSKCREFQTDLQIISHLKPR